MTEDAVIEEVRRVKKEHAAQYGYDVDAMVRALQEQQKHEKREIVSPPRDEAEWFKARGQARGVDFSKYE